LLPVDLHTVVCLHREVGPSGVCGRQVLQELLTMFVILFIGRC